MCAGCEAVKLVGAALLAGVGTLEIPEGDERLDVLRAFGGYLATIVDWTDRVDLGQATREQAMDGVEAECTLMMKALSPTARSSALVMGTHLKDILASFKRGMSMAKLESEDMDKPREWQEHGTGAGANIIVIDLGPNPESEG